MFAAAARKRSSSRYETPPGPQGTRGASATSVCRIGSISPQALGAIEVQPVPRGGPDFPGRAPVSSAMSPSRRASGMFCDKRALPAGVARATTRASSPPRMRATTAGSLSPLATPYCCVVLTSSTPASARLAVEASAASMPLRTVWPANELLVAEVEARTASELRYVLGAGGSTTLRRCETKMGGLATHRSEGRLESALPVTTGGLIRVGHHCLRAPAFAGQISNGQCFAARTKSLSVVSSVSSWRMQSWASKASMVPICTPARRQAFRTPAAAT